MAKITLYRRHAHHTVRVPKNGLRKLLFRPPKPKVLLICLVCLIEAPFEWLKTVLALENCKKEIFGPQWDLSCVPMLYRLFSIVDCPIQIHSVKPVLLESDMETDIVVAPLRNFFAVFFFGILRFNNPLWFFSGFIFTGEEDSRTSCRVFDPGVEPRNPLRWEETVHPSLGLEWGISICAVERNQKKRNCPSFFFYRL